jgi:hypothetical protein
MSWLSFDRIIRRFPGVLALNEVSLSIERGECHAIVGENGREKARSEKSSPAFTRRIPEKFGSTIELSFRAIHSRLAGWESPWFTRNLRSVLNLSVAENLCLGSLPEVQVL